MANNITPKLKAFVQIDGTGRVVSGTPVFRTSKPKSGRWREIPLYYRGDNPSSTTTTTTSGGGGTPTAFIRRYFLNTFNTCNSTTDGDLLFYSSSSTLQAGISVFTDAALTTPVTEGFVIVNQPQPMQFFYYLVGAFGTISLFTCPTSNQISAVTNYNAYDACQGSGNTLNLFYPLNQSLGNGTTLFFNAALTIPYDTGAAGNYVRLYFQAEDQVCTMSGNTIQSYTACSGITTTTTTTVAPVFSVVNQRWGDTQGDACGSVNPLTTFYTTGPLQGNYIQDGNVIYLDEALTQPVQYPYIVSPGIGRLLDCNNGVLSNQRSCF